MRFGASLALMLGTLVAAAALSGCVTPPASRSGAPARNQDAFAFVVAAPNSQYLLRTIRNETGCPTALIDGRSVRLSLRTAPETAPVRATVNASSLSKPAEFPVTVCEAPLPANVRTIVANGQSLGVPRSRVSRLIVIGDTGCRMKASDHAFQDCTDPSTWPFALIAQHAADEHPDLVIHVGDYHYRETPCPSEIAGCRGSPWGYGWDAWQADFFSPARPLLTAAPWVVIRGNHEECSRAGQGWFRFLEPRAYNRAVNCDDASQDDVANFTAPYVVNLNAGQAILVFDSARSGVREASMKAQALAKLTDAVDEAAQRMADEQREIIFVSHHPVLGMNPGAGSSAAFEGTPLLIEALTSRYGLAYFPPKVALALSGHVHLFQTLDFSSDHPGAIVAGNGGDALDNDASLNGALGLLEGVRLSRWVHSGRFGYLVMDRIEDGWAITAKAVDQSVLARCESKGRKIICAEPSNSAWSTDTSPNAPLQSATTLTDTSGS